MISAGGKLTGSLEDKEWYEYRRNGAYTIHRPGLLNDKDFQSVLESVIKQGDFGMDRPLPNIGCTFYGNLYVVLEMLQEILTNLAVTVTTAPT